MSLISRERMLLAQQLRDLPEWVKPYSRWAQLEADQWEWDQKRKEAA